jgi:hypothetical protein
LANERRKFRRMVVEALAFAILRPRFKKLIRIINMSRNGLACEYLVHKKMSKAYAEPKVDVLLFKDKFHRAAIPCKVVYEIKMFRNEYGVNNGMEKRRCGLQFNEPSDEQREQIELFMKDYVAETVKRKLPGLVSLAASMGKG